jgi:hypothetical protein
LHEVAGITTPTLRSVIQTILDNARRAHRMRGSKTLPRAAS